MIEQFKFYILPSAITFIGIIYIQSKIMNVKFDFKSKHSYLAMILFLILNILSYLYVDGFLRMVVNTIIIILVSYSIFKLDINNIVGAVLLEQILYFISEFLAVVLLVIIGINPESMNTNLIVFIILNLVVSLVAIILFNIPFIKKKISNIMIYLSNITSIKKYILAFVFFITLNVFLVLLYFYDNKCIIIINSVFIIIYTAIMYFTLNEKNENIRFKQENEELLTNLNEYEKMLDYQRVSNHENKNQLLIIRSMISKNNTKALNYLDEIITEKRKDDEGLYTYAKIIPEGGLQGLVYQKMLKMKEYDIKINLNVNRTIRKIKFDKISSKVNYDLCKAVGIILDNAIEETIKLIEKEILIVMYSENNEFIIEVSNKCETIPDLSRLDEEGYTTKTEGHGYGLCLLKNIVSNNDCITNERSLNKDIFTQIIKIKM